MPDVESRWYHLAICHNMDINSFYDKYESDEVFAATMDQICLSCPVRAMCLQEGVENKEYGLWGGVFLTNGQVNTARNEHKTQDIWSAIRGGIRAR